MFQVSVCRPLRPNRDLNSENPSLEEELVSLDDDCRRGHLLLSNSNSTVGSAILTASLLTNLRSIESLKIFPLLAVEGFEGLPNLPFSEEWVKRIHIPKKKFTENGIGLKE